MLVLIENGTIIAFDGHEHRFLDHGEVAFEGNRIVYVGRNYEGHVDEKIDAKGKIVMPGLLSLHTHTTNSHYLRGFAEDAGSKNFNMSMLVEYTLPVNASIGREEALTACKAALFELLRSGCTFFLEMGTDFLGAGIAQDAAQEVARLATEVGIRACIVPGYRSARRYTKDGKSMTYEWNEERGYTGLNQNIEFIKRCRTNHDGLVSSLLGPASPDVCTPDLLKETVAKAKELDARIQTHGAQSVFEFREIMSKHGKTPVEFMNDVGLLSPNTMIAHCVYISTHPRVLTPWANDFELLTKSGATVVHCPTEFARRGAVLYSYYKYVRAGMNVALGLDICPHDMLEEMRIAAHLTKCVDFNCLGGTARQLFDSATLAAARALGREDLGGLRKGALADIVIVKTSSARMSPIRDPVKNLVYHATSSDVETVIVDGKTVLTDGKVLALDEEKVVEELQKTAERLWMKVKEKDWAGRGVDELSPLSLRPLEEEQN